MTRMTNGVREEALEALGMSPNSYGWTQCTVKIRAPIIEVIGSHWKRQFRRENGALVLTEHPCNKEHNQSVYLWQMPPINNLEGGEEE